MTLEQMFWNEDFENSDVVDPFSNEAVEKIARMMDTNEDEEPDSNFSH